MFECYDEIIGLSSEDCNCTANERPANYNESKSEIYLDELASISSLVGLAECNSNVWKAMQEAVKSGIKQFVADTNALLGKKHRLKRKLVSKVMLGQSKSTKTITPEKNYAAVTYSCAPVRSGYMRVRKIGGVFAGAGTVSVELRDNLGNVHGSYDIVTIPDKLVTVPVDLQLPLYDNSVDCVEYYLTYLFDVNNKPKATEISCGCGGTVIKYDKKNPYTANIGSHKAAPWTDYVMVGGREINSLSELDDEVTTLSNKVYGLTLEVDFGCKVDEVLCEESLDFVGNPLALSTAIAIKYISGVKLKEKLFKTRELNAENMINFDQWEEDADQWQEQYNENVNYIVNQADITANDCLACKTVHGLARKGLFS